MLEFEAVPMPENLELFEQAYFEGYKFFDSMIDQLGLRDQCYSNGCYDCYLANQIMKKIIFSKSDSDKQRIAFLNRKLSSSLQDGDFNSFIGYYSKGIGNDIIDIKTVWVMYEKLNDMYYSKHVGDIVTEKNSLMDYHEDYGYCYDEKTVFAYSKARIFM